MNLTEFPEELQLLIFSHLDAIELARVGCVCRTWNRIAADELLWYNLMLQFVGVSYLRSSLKSNSGSAGWRDQWIEITKSLTALSNASSSRDNLRLKVCLCGIQSGGKSSLCARLIRREFYNDMESTIGASFYAMCQKVYHTEVFFEFWDLSGNLKYMSLTPMYLRGAQVSLFCVDATRLDESLDYWKHLYQQAFAYYEDMATVLVLCKFDLVSGDGYRDEIMERLYAFADVNKMSGVVKCSAAEDEEFASLLSNISLAFATHRGAVASMIQRNTEEGELVMRASHHPHHHCVLL